MSAGRLRVALIGYGGVGRVFHAPPIGHTPGREFALVASLRGDELARALPGVEVLATPQQSSYRGDIDLAVVASPNATHAAQAEAALRAGCHVAVGMRFTHSLAVARDLARLAARSGRVLAVFCNRRWDSDFLALRELLAGGQFGRLTSLESRFDHFPPQLQDRWRERADDGGGVGLDLGPHRVDRALQLFGLPARVGARLSRQRDGAVAA